MSRSGFYINGNINTYPDIIAMTEKGNILLIEPKGDHLENAESRQKLALGRTWQNKAGANYHYYMVFKNKDLALEGAYLLKEFLETVKGL